MLGPAMGSLSVYAVENDVVSSTPLWTVSGDQGLPWHKAAVDVVIPSTGLDVSYLEVGVKQGLKGNDRAKNKIETFLEVRNLVLGCVSRVCISQFIYTATVLGQVQDPEFEFPTAQQASGIGSPLNGMIKCRSRKK